jgi:hypothetical protein
MGETIQGEPDDPLAFAPEVARAVLEIQVQGFLDHSGAFVPPWDDAARVKHLERTERKGAALRASVYVPRIYPAAARGLNDFSW